MGDLAARLKKVRGEQSAKAFAALLGCSPQTIYRYEWGERVPDESFLQSVAQKTGYPLNWLRGTETALNDGKRNRKRNAPSTETMCSQCVELRSRIKKAEAKLDALEEERREVSAENRRLHNALEEAIRKNGELRAQVARLEECLKFGGGGSQPSVSGADAQSA